MHDATTTDRASHAAQLTVKATLDATYEYLREAGVPAEVDEQRFTSRAFVAGALSLLGKEDDNAWHLATPIVVVGRKINRNNVVYSEAGVALSNVAVRDDTFVFPDRISPATAKTARPEELVEGQAHIYARQGEQRPEIAGRVGSWLADVDMPSDYQGRGYYGIPRHLGSLAHTMLKSLADPHLNGDFHTLAFIKGVNEGLAEAVEDHTVPKRDFQESIVLPSWLSTPTPA